MKIFKLTGLILITFYTFSVFSQPSKVDFSSVKGLYFGQVPPKDKAILFAPDLLKSEMGYHSTIVFSPDLNHAYWSPMEKDRGVLWHSEMIKGVWSRPEEITLGIDNGNTDFILSVDGQKLFFLSFYQENKIGIERERIWFVEKAAQGWSKAQLIDKVVWDHTTHWTFSLNKKQDLYFTSEIKESKGINLAKYNGRNYEIPVKLFEGSMPFIDPDERYILYVIISDNTKSDIYIRFKDENGKWSEAIKMGPEINSAKHDLAPHVSPDGKYLFFISQRETMNGMMWVSTAIIEKLRKEAKFL